MKKYTKHYKDIITAENLLRVWQEFLPGKKNRPDVAAFQARLMDNLFHLYAALKEKTYRHGAYHAFNISDPKPRNIHKATVRDRLLHHLLHAELYGYFDGKFIYDSYSCRIRKGTHKAMDRFTDFCRTVSLNNTRTVWILKCDIRKFFANIDHQILKEILFRYIADANLLDLFGRIIESFSTEGRPAVGLPLGNLTSQLFVNIYMNEFDQFVKRELKAKYYIRYADDFAVLSEDRKWLESLLPKIAEFLDAKLQLALHPDKVFIKTLASGVDFLGWVHFPHYRVLRTATKRRMFANPGIAAGDGTVIRSYKGLLSHGNTHKLQSRISVTISAHEKR